MKVSSHKNLFWIHKFIPWLPYGVISKCQNWENTVGNFFSHSYSHFRQLSLSLEQENIF